MNRNWSSFFNIEDLKDGENLRDFENLKDDERDDEKDEEKDDEKDDENDQNLWNNPNLNEYGIYFSTLCFRI